MNRPLRIPLRAVIYREEGRLVAHCLEFDICGDGVDLENALASLNEAIEIQIEHSIEHNNPENLFSPAPGKFFEMFASGRNVTVGELEVTRHSPCPDIEIEQLDAREYTDAGHDDLVCV